MRTLYSAGHRPTQFFAQAQPVVNVVTTPVEVTSEPVRHTRSGYSEDQPRGYDRTLDRVTEQLRPKWNGEDSTWEDFWVQWIYFWSLKGKQLGDDDRLKCFIFIECLPLKEKQRAMNFVTQDNMSFDSL